MPRRAATDLALIDAITSAQLGLIAMAQLAEAGVSRSTTQRRIRTGGPWSRVLPGIYLVTGGSPDRSQQRVAALLYAGPGAVLTGRDALHLCGAAPLPPVSAPLHVLVPHEVQRSSKEFVVVERTRRAPSSLTRSGLPVAPVARATVDLARRLRRRDDVEAMLAKAVQQGFTTVQALDVEVRAAHRRSTALLRDAMVNIAAGTRSAPEAALRRLWLESGSPEPLWNPRLLTLEGRFLGVPDAYVTQAGVAVEVDSVEFHLSPDDWRRTMERHARFAAQGVVVVHAPPSRISRDGTGLMALVIAAIRAQDGRQPPSIRIDEG